MRRLSEDCSLWSLYYPFLELHCCSQGLQCGVAVRSPSEDWGCRSVAGEDWGCSEELQCAVPPAREREARHAGREAGREGERADRSKEEQRQRQEKALQEGPRRERQLQAGRTLL